MKDKYLSIGQAAQLLGISKGTIRRAVSRGELAVALQMPGGALRFQHVDVDLYARRLGARPGLGSVSGTAQRTRTRLDGRPPLGTVGDLQRSIAGHATSSPLASAVATMLDAGFDRPATLSNEAPDTPSLIKTILALCANSLNAGAAELTRVTGEGWRIVHVYDRMGMGVVPGNEAPLSAALERALCNGNPPAIVVEDVQNDARLVGLAVTYQPAGSFVGTPLFHTNGELYGLLCVLYPQPRKVGGDEIALLRLAGSIVVQLLAIESNRRA
jgi:excisionase family DNA binding protein